MAKTHERPRGAGVEHCLATRDHDVIRRWAEECDAEPATIAGTDHDGRLGVLQFDVPGGDSPDASRLRHVSWDEWFRTFDERGLNFIYVRRENPND